jgi:hypothetical protein
VLLKIARFSLKTTQNPPKKAKKGPKTVCRIYNTVIMIFYKLFIQWHLLYGQAGKSVSRGWGGGGYPEKRIKKANKRRIYHLEKDGFARRKVEFQTSFRSQRTLCAEWA